MYVIQMSTQIIELRPNRSYLDPNFNGYKLSLAEIPCVREELNASVLQVFPSKDQYAFLHAKLFSLHNYLVGETLDDCSYVYFIDENFFVKKVYYSNANSVINIVDVWELPVNLQNERTYYCSFKFASDTKAILTDGNGMLYILDTGCRKEDGTWNSTFGNYVLENEKAFVIQDVIYVDGNLSCLLFSVEQQNSSSKHSVIFHLVSLVEGEDKSWNRVALRKLECKGDFYYAYLERNGNAVYSVTNSGLKLFVDSETAVSTNCRLDEEVNWFEIQTESQVILKLHYDFVKDISVKIDGLQINIKHGDTILLKGELCHTVKSDSISWKTENNILEVTLEKEDKTVAWNRIIKNKTNKCEIENTIALANQLGESEEPKGPLFTTQQIEDCDSEDLAIFERLCINSHKVTHRATVGSHQVLLTTQLMSDQAPAMAIRYDVDGCLWQPIETENGFRLIHEGTLLAFGYIQASKQQKKFSQCSSDLSYSVVCEATRHLFIYKHNSKITSELKNRKSGKCVKTMCQQHVINLSGDNVLGIYAANATLFLLTENSVLILKMQQ